MLAGITQVAEAMVSIRRLQNFMLYEEVSTRVNRSMVYRKDNDEAAPKKKKKSKNKYAVPSDAPENGKALNGVNEASKDEDEEQGEEQETVVVDEIVEDGYVRLISATAKWLASDKDDTLRKIDLDVKPGELIAVVGQVGAGKSSLLNVILKELPLTSGSIQVRSRSVD